MRSVSVFLFVIFTVLIFPASAYAWQLKDSSKVLDLNKEVFDMVYNHSALAKQKGFLSLEIAKKIGFLFGEAQANGRLGVVYDVEGKYDSSLYFYKRSLFLYKKGGYKKGEGATLCNLGLLQLNRNNYFEALQYLHAAIKPLESVNELLFLGNCYNNIGLLHYELDNYPKAEANFRLAVSYYDKVNNVYQKAKAIGNLAMLYSDIGKKDSSIILEYEAVRIFEKEEDYYNLAKSFNNIGILLHETGKGPEAEKAFLNSVKFAIRSGHNAGLADTYINLATYYNESGDKTKSNLYTKLAYYLAEQIESPKLKADIYYYYARICVKEGNHKLASKLLISSKMIRDSIFKNEIAAKIASQEARFGLERKENENRALKQKNRIQELEIINKQNKIRSRQILIGGIAALSILLLIFTVYYLRRRFAMQRLRDDNIHRNEQHKQRVHISHELHDNVGAQLSYIVSNLDILQESNPGDPRVKSVSEMSRQAIVTLRETVWALNNESISLTGFTDKFKQYIHKIMEYNENISYTFEDDISIDHTLQPMQALNLFRISQEAFSNAVRHSEASNIRVYISADKDYVTILDITDNGTGFDQEKAEEKGHYGLHTMRSRAGEMGAEFDIKSRIGHGSTVTIKLSK